VSSNWFQDAKTEVKSINSFSKKVSSNRVNRLNRQQTEYEDCKF